MDKDASQLEPTCFSKASQILFATVTRLLFIGDSQKLLYSFLLHDIRKQIR